MILNASAVVLVLACHLATSAALTNWTNCSKVCACAKDDVGKIHAHCTLNRLPDADMSTLPENVYTLSIDASEMETIPANSFARMTSIRELILRNNSIRTIRSGAFKGLVTLKTLDLRNNHLQYWSVDPNQDLPSLEIIKLSGNEYWGPDEKILRLNSLKELQGVSWSEHCTECTLKKTTGSLGNDSTEMQMNGDANFTMRMRPMICKVTADSFFLHHHDVKYGQAYEYVKLGFSPQCLCQLEGQDCYNDELTQTYFRQLYEIPKRLFYVQCGLGFAILCLNLVIVVFILSSISLRRNVSFILIGSMALSDVFVGVYSVEISIFNPFTASTVTPNQIQENDMKVCPYLGVVFTTGQVTTVFTSLFLTVERYLAIVYCDKPTSRLSSKFSLSMSAIIWILALTYALLPLFGVKQLQYHKWFQCTMPFHKSSVISDTSTATFVIAVGFVLVYLVSIGMYIRIYIFVRQSSAHLGVKREARLAKRISLVVGTNFIFFVTPLVLFLVYVYRFMDVLFDVASTFASLQAFIIMGSWLPVTLLGLSSLLNPFLYAFRHQRFQREVRRMTRRWIRRFSGDSIYSHGSRSSRDKERKRSLRSRLRKNENSGITTEIELQERLQHVN